VTVKPGDVVFHCGKGLLARAVKLATRSPWSHVSLVIATCRDDFTILDVLDTRVVQAISRHRGDHTWHARAPVLRAGWRRSQWFEKDGSPKDIAREHVVRQALDLHSTLPREYPGLELLAYVPGVRRTALGRRILRHTDRMVCSALVAAAWYSMGLRWFDNDGDELSPDWADPGTMWRQACKDAWPVVETKRSYDGRPERTYL